MAGHRTKEQNSRSCRRNRMRKRISTWLAGKSKRPHINRLDADAIEVFDEYNLRAQDFTSVMHQAKMDTYPDKRMPLTGNEITQVKKTALALADHYRQGKRRKRV